MLKRNELPAWVEASAIDDSFGNRIPHECAVTLLQSGIVHDPEQPGN